MPNRPAPPRESSGSNGSTASNAPPNPDREYQDATESKLDHSKPPHHDKTAADKKHKDDPQLSIGKP